MTPLLLVKLIRDLRAIWDRILLMILAMSFTLIVFSGLLYTRAITSREMPAAYLSTHPASATILLDHTLNANQMEAIVAHTREQPGIIDATLRAQYTLQVQQEDGGWGPSPLQIFVAAPDDPMQIETFKVEQGKWPPAAGEILIDRSSFDLLNLAVGKDVVVQAPSGQPVTLRVSGVVYDPALAPSYQEQVGHGFISTETLPLLGEPLALDELKIQVADRPGSSTPSASRDVIEATARNLARWLQQSYSVTINEIQVPTPYAHPHQFQMDLLTEGLLIFGVAGLVLSAILVATMLNGMFAQQIPQIGIMKAVGASSRRILQLYLLMTCLIAVIATSVAFIPGIAFSRGFAPVMLSMVGIDTTSVAVPWWMYALVIIAGVGVPILFSVISMIKTSRTTVRKALDYHGVDRTSSSTTGLFTWLGKLPVFDGTVRLAFRNIFRHRSRFLLTVGLLASAGSVFVAGLSTMGSVLAVPEQAKQLRPWDVDVQLAKSNPGSGAGIISLVEQIPHVVHVEAWTNLPTSIARLGELSLTRTYPDQGHGSMPVTIIPSGTSLLTPPPLLEGRWLQPDETGAVVIAQSVRDSGVLPDVHAGEMIQLSLGGHPTPWRVVGISQTIFGGASIYATANGLAKATGGMQTNALRIVTDSHDEATRTAVASQVDRTLTGAGFQVKSLASVGRMEAATAGHMLPLVMIFLSLAIAMGVVGWVGLGTTMSTNVLERTREFGVMHAIGARPAAVRRIVVTEGIFMAVASCVIGAVPAVLLTAGMIAGVGSELYGAMRFQISVPAVVIWVVVVILGAALSTLAPAFRASRLTVREALAYL